MIGSLTIRVGGKSLVLTLDEQGKWASMDPRAAQHFNVCYPPGSAPNLMDLPRGIPELLQAAREWHAVPQGLRRRAAPVKDGLTSIPPQPVQGVPTNAIAQGHQQVNDQQEHPHGEGGG